MYAAFRAGRLSMAETAFIKLKAGIFYEQAAIRA